MSFVGSGIPLIYNGQEADLDRQLAFFEKDEIEWQTGKHDELFRKLIALKTAEPALWNGKYGAPMVEVPNSASDQVYSFVRGEAGNRVFAIFNLSPTGQKVSFNLARHHGDYVDALSGEKATFGDSEGSLTEINLPPWGFRIFREAE